MRFTIPYIEKKFEEFNQQMFADKLPKPVFELSNAKTFLGLCVSQKRKLANGDIEQYNFRLRFNTRIDLEAELMEDIIIVHEMIHYYIAYNNIIDDSPHGTVFMQKMNHIMNTYGIRVTIAFDPTDEYLVNSITRPRYVCVSEFKDGRMDLGVVAKNKIFQI